jgi:hypothetical protein
MPRAFGEQYQSAIAGVQSGDFNVMTEMNMVALMTIDL